MIALIGEKEIWRGFVPLGVKLFEADTRDEVVSCIQEVSSSDFMFVLISDGTAIKIEDLLESLYKKLNIVLLPSIESGSNPPEDQLYFKRLKAITKKAMGVDILS
ncbi:MAG: hypothetical protein GY817_04005 [bacterium]|nr:hypothetical protein [bacterium]